MTLINFRFKEHTRERSERNEKINCLISIDISTFGCNQIQEKTGTKTTTANDSKETSASIPPQDLESNHTYLDAEILETWEEDGQFSLNLVHGFMTV